MRQTFIKTLISEAKKNKNIILLTGDLGFSVLEKFRDKFPNRFLNMGVAEQNMMGVAAGMALSGKIVFTYSIATFITMRDFEHIRNDIASHKLSVVIVGVGEGLCYGHASITHHSIEDINLMRGIPNMTILCPGDPTEVIWATKAAIRLKKPVYLRLGKQGEAIVYRKMPKFRIGKGEFLVKGKDLAIIATGNIVDDALKASYLLLKRGLSSSVISMHTLKPIDTNLVNSLAKQYPLLVTIEEHSLIGGLGSAVAEILAEQNFKKAKLKRLGIPDRFVKEIGSHEYLREKLGLDPKNLAKTILKTFKEKK